MTTVEQSGSADKLAQAFFGHRARPLRDGRPPSAEEWEVIFTAASSVPDHGAIQPWRFVTVEGDARERLADALGADAVEAELEPARVERARAKAFAAPALAIIVAKPDTSRPIPVWEQVVTASLTGYAVVLAAQALGLGGSWRSPTAPPGGGLREFLRLGDDEQVLGWVLLGEADPDTLEPAKPRPPVQLAERVTFVR